MSVLSTPQQRDSDRKGRGRGHWPLTAINKYLQQSSLKQSLAARVCRYISLYKALEWKESSWKPALILPVSCGAFAVKTRGIHIDLSQWDVWVFT